MYIEINGQKYFYVDPGIRYAEEPEWPIPGDQSHEASPAVKGDDAEAAANEIESDVNQDLSDRPSNP